VDAPKLLRNGNLNPENVADVVSGMSGVVNEGGTGRFAALPGIKVCGKTGTAQVISLQAQKGNVAANLKDNAWFVGFAPQEAPEIVVVALFENGEHGDRASWIVRDVLKAYFDKKARKTSGEATQLESFKAPGFFSSPNGPLATLGVRPW
jgi:penicillin-binding protein 2